MNEKSNVSENLDMVQQLAQQVVAEDVASFLRENPRFLVENRELLTEIEVLLNDSGVVSLTQIQSNQYREKITQLKTQLSALVNNARRNEDIYKAYAQLNIDIAQTQSFETLTQALHRTLVVRLGLEELQLVLLDEHINPSNITLSEIQQHSIFDKKLAKNNFYLGRLGKLERQALFPEAQAESVAILKLGENKAFGLLAIASKDPLHFTPEMDTMLIDFLRKNLNLHIPKLG